LTVFAGFQFWQICTSVE